MELGTKLPRRAAWLTQNFYWSCRSPIPGFQVYRVWRISIWPLEPLSVLLHAVLGPGDCPLWILCQLLTLWPQVSSNRRSRRRKKEIMIFIPWDPFLVEGGLWWLLSSSKGQNPYCETLSANYSCSNGFQCRNDNFTPTRLGCFTSLFGSYLHLCK